MKIEKIIEIYNNVKDLKDLNEIYTKEEVTLDMVCESINDIIIDGCHEEIYHVFELLLDGESNIYLTSERIEQLKEYATYALYEEDYVALEDYASLLNEIEYNTEDSKFEFHHEFCGRVYTLDDCLYTKIYECWENEEFMKFILNL